MKSAMRTLLAAGSLACAAAASAAPVYYNGHNYDVTAPGLTWTAAEAAAVAAGGHLVAVNDAAEQTFLTATFAGQLFWIGYNDAAIEGTFVWSNGDPTTYTNWFGGEPNNVGGVPGEDYTVMNWGVAGAWNDCPNNACGAGARGIIEYVPEPATSALLGLGLLGLGALRRRIG